LVQGIINAPNMAARPVWTVVGSEPERVRQSLIGVHVSFSLVLDESGLPVLVHLWL
jgi:hypothetical protein